MREESWALTHWRRDGGVGERPGVEVSLSDGAPC